MAAMVKQIMVFQGSNLPARTQAASKFLRTQAAAGCTQAAQFPSSLLHPAEKSQGREHGVQVFAFPLRSTRSSPTSAYAQGRVDCHLTGRTQVM